MYLIEILNDTVKVQQSPLFIIVSSLSSIMLMVIVFFLSRLIRSYDVQLKEMRQATENYEIVFDKKIEALKTEITKEILAMNNDKFAYRLEQMKQITNIQTTQNLMTEILKEIRNEQRQQYIKQNL